MTEKLIDTLEDDIILNAFTEAEIKELREAFNVFDKDGNGQITTDELRTVVHGLRQDFTDEDIKQMIDLVDVDGDGVITLSEFLEIMEDLRLMQSAEDEWLQAFRAFDKDGDGYINGDDILATMKGLGEELTKAEVDIMVKEADLNGDGKINYGEFMRMMRDRFSQTLDNDTLGNDKFSKTQKAELKLAFSLFDKDRDGFISKQEVSTVMHAMRQPITDQKLSEVFQQVDLDGNGLIDFEEFVRMMEQRLERRPEEAELRQLFAAFDHDQNGYIDPKELKRTMQELGTPVSDADVKQMMKEAGVLISGRIYYEDFVKMMSGKIGREHRKMQRKSLENIDPTSGDSIDEPRDEDPEVRELRIAFMMFDKDADGVINTQELLQVFKQLGMDTSTEQIQRMMKKVDLDGNGSIDFEEFKRMMRKRKGLAAITRQERRAEEEEMRAAFKVFDKDKNGYIDDKELRVTMQELGMKLSENDLVAMMASAGVKKGGRIYYEEFVRILFGQVIKPIPESGSLSDSQMQELKVAFALFDKNGDGAISGVELRSVMRTLGLSQDEKLIDRMIKKFDLDKNGMLEFDEFINMMSQRDRRKSSSSADTRPTEPEAWRAFKVFDKDRSGYITAEEIRQTMKELGIELTLNDVELMIKEADQDGDGKINYKEFTQMFQGKFKPIILEPLPPPQTATNPNQTDVITDARIAPLTTSNSARPAMAKAPNQPSIPEGYTIEDIKQAFDMFDQDKNGVIAASELGNVMRTLGLPFSSKELHSMVKNVDIDGNGTIDFNEFLRMMSRTTIGSGNNEEARKRRMEAEMRQAFKVFDIDGNGVIDAQELRLTMNNLGEKLNEKDIKAMIKSADKDGDGKINYEEFIKMMYNK